MESLRLIIDIHQYRFSSPFEGKTWFLDIVSQDSCGSVCHLWKPSLTVVKSHGVWAEAMKTGRHTLFARLARAVAFGCAILGLRLSSIIGLGDGSNATWPRCTTAPPVIVELLWKDAEMTICKCVTIWLAPTSYRWMLLYNRHKWKMNPKIWTHLETAQHSGIAPGLNINGTARIVHVFPERKPPPGW